VHIDTYGEICGHCD